MLEIKSSFWAGLRHVREILKIAVATALLYPIGSAAAGDRVRTGLEVFMSRYTSLVQGQRVGLITNPTGVDRHLQATVDIFMASPAINLVALFAPEHGIRGDVEAGKSFQTTHDKRTGLPIYSLYGGRDHRPPPGSLDQVDVLVYHIQDIGCRSYTYIWHLAECMSAAAEAGKTMIVLDVPNPLGAVQIDGPVTERQHLSFIGLYPVPFVYGLTVGELARYLNREENIRCKLYIVPMANYRRGMSWDETGLPWVPTSPQIPSPQSACCYAVTGSIGALGIVGIGIGYTLPFQVVAAPWIDAEHMADALNRLRLGGVRFRPIHFKPYFGLFSGQNTHGVQLHITDHAAFRPTTCTVAILCYLQKYYRQFTWRPDRIAGFDRAMGTDRVRVMIQAGNDYRAVVNAWQSELDAFRRRIEPYKIYQ